MIQVKVTDDGTPALSVTNSFTLTVAEVNAAPSLTLPGDSTINELAAYAAAATATDADVPANTLTFALLSGPSGLSVSPGGAIAWTPTERQGPGDYPVTVRVTDNGTPSLDDSETISIHVDEVNTAPVLAAIGNQSVAEGAALRFTASATDSDHALKAYSATGSMHTQEDIVRS